MRGLLRPFGLSYALRRTFGRVAPVLALLFAIQAGDVNAAGPPSLEAYGRLQQIEGVSMSPGGQVFAAVIRNDSGAVITVFDATTAKPLDYLGLGNDKFRDMMWVDDDRLVIIRSVTATIRGVMAPKGEQFVALEYNFKTRRGRPLLMGTDQALNTVVGDVVRVRDGSGPARLVLDGVNFPQGVGVLSLFEQGSTGTARVIAQGKRDTVDWIVGPRFLSSNRDRRGPPG